MFFATLFLQDMVEIRRRIRLKCKIGPGGKCIMASGFRYTLSRDDKKSLGGRKNWGKDVAVSMDVTMICSATKGGS